MPQNIILGSIQWQLYSPKTNSLHAYLIAVNILQHTVRFPVFQFFISLHYIQKQPTTTNYIYTHISPHNSSLYPHQSNLLAALY
jgi:hypothetical protein